METSTYSGGSANNYRDCTQCRGTGKKQIWVDSNASSSGNSNTSPRTDCIPLTEIVNTPHGKVLAGDLMVGDYIYALTKNGNLKSVEILKTSQSPKNQIFSVETSDGGKFRATASHSFRTARGFCRVNELRIGTQMIKLSSLGTIIEVDVVKIGLCCSEETVKIVSAGNCTFIVSGMVSHSYSYLRGMRTFLCQISQLGKKLKSAGYRLNIVRSAIRSVSFNAKAYR